MPAQAYVMPEANDELFAELRANAKARKLDGFALRDAWASKREAARLRVEEFNNWMPVAPAPGSLRRFRQKSICGVYFLYFLGRIVYVGQSVDVRSRISQHTREKTFDEYAFVRCPEVWLDILEAVYIQRINPPLNRTQGNLTHGQLLGMGVACHLAAPEKPR
jgi:hypothetical protein